MAKVVSFHSRSGPSNVPGSRGAGSPCATGKGSRTRPARPPFLTNGDEPPAAHEGRRRRPTLPHTRAAAILEALCDRLERERLTPELLTWTRRQLEAVVRLTRASR